MMHCHERIWENSNKNRRNYAKYCSVHYKVIDILQYNCKMYFKCPIYLFYPNINKGCSKNRHYQVQDKDQPRSSKEESGSRLRPKRLSLYLNLLASLMYCINDQAMFSTKKRNCFLSNFVYAKRKDTNKLNFYNIFTYLRRPMLKAKTSPSKNASKFETSSSRYRKCLQTRLKLKTREPYLNRL